jgi:hypothetical protein
MCSFRQLHRLLVALLTVAFVALAAPSAHGQNEAASQFREAKRLYDKDEYEAALSVFKLAWQRSKSPNARLYIGRCLLKMDKLLPAYDEFRATMFDASGMAKEDDKYLTTRDAAAAELALLELRIGRVLITPDATARDAPVGLDGEVLPDDKLGELVVVLPGAHKIEAHAPDRVPFSQDIEVAPGKTVAVAVRLPTPEGDEVADTGAGGPLVAGKKRPEGLTTMQIFGVSTVVVGGAVLVLAAASGAAAASRFSALEQICGDERCSDESAVRVVDTGKRFETLAYIGAAVGGAAVIAGGALIIFGGPSDDDSDAAALTPLPGGGMLTYRGTF